MSYKSPSSFTLLTVSVLVQRKPERPKMVESHPKKEIKLYPKSIPTILWDYLVGRWFLFCADTSTHGYKFLAQFKRPFVDRIYWAFVLFSISILTLWIILVAYIPFLNTPTVTIEMPVWLPVKDIDFPAVAFCNNNFISRRALLKYSEFV